MKSPARGRMAGLQTCVLEGHGRGLVLRVGPLVAQDVESARDDLVFLAIIDLGRGNLDAAHCDRHDLSQRRRTGRHGVGQRQLDFLLEVVDVCRVLHQHRELAAAQHLAAGGGRGELRTNHRIDLDLAIQRQRHARADLRRDARHRQHRGGAGELAGAGRGGRCREVRRRRGRALQLAHQGEVHARDAIRLHGDVDLADQLVDEAAIHGNARILHFSSEPVRGVAGQRREGALAGRGHGHWVAFDLHRHGAAIHELTRELQRGGRGDEEVLAVVGRAGGQKAADAHHGAGVVAVGQERAGATRQAGGARGDGVLRCGGAAGGEVAAQQRGQQYGVRAAGGLALDGARGSEVTQARVALLLAGINLVARVLVGVRVERRCHARVEAAAGGQGLGAFRCLLADYEQAVDAVCSGHGVDCLSLVEKKDRRGDLCGVMRVTGCRTSES